MNRREQFMNRKEQLLPKLIIFNLCLAIIMILCAFVFTNTGDALSKHHFVENIGRTFLTMFGIQPFFVAFWLYWKSGE